MQLIVGRSVDSLYPSPPPLRDDVALEVKGVAGGSVQDLTLTLHRGEIVGITGLVGSGIEQALA